jgi:hypothetical protein
LIFFPLVALALAGVYLYQHHQEGKTTVVTAPATIERKWVDRRTLPSPEAVDRIEIASAGKTITLTFDHGSVGGLSRGQAVTFARTPAGTPMWLKTEAGKEYDTQDNPASQASFFLFMACFMAAVGALVLVALRIWTRSAARAGSGVPQNPESGTGWLPG